MDTSEKYSELQRNVLQAITERYRDKYICKDTMFLLLLAGNSEQISGLAKLDFVYQMIQTSLQFRQYRRASWYLLAFLTLCRQNMGDSVLERLQTSLTTELDSKPAY